MKNFFSKFKIPTLLGLGIIFLGIGAGVYLTLREQTFISQASPDVSLKDITLSNISDDSVTISWQTSASAPSFLTYGIQNPGEQTILDDRDSGSPKFHTVHYVTLKNLLPQTSYQYKIISGKVSSEIARFTTAAPATIQIDFRPIIGSVLNGDKPLDEGIAYLSIAGATTLSSLIRDSGNFIIPLSQIRKEDLSDSFSPSEETVAKLTIISSLGDATTLFRLKDSEAGLPTVELGQSLDLTTLEKEETNKFDLNGDGKINTADNAIILQNFGKDPQNKKADLNSDGIVDQKDLDLLSEQINK